MPTCSYDYAYIRLVPRVEQGEFLNVGVLLFCRVKKFLQARIILDDARLAAFAPHLDAARVRHHLELIPQLCAGQGPIGALGQADVFHWLVAPHSTIIQTSPVHSGICEDPEAALQALAQTLSR